MTGCGLWSSHSLVEISLALRKGPGCRQSNAFTPRCLKRPCGGPFENREGEEMALLIPSSNLSPRGGLSTTLITLASKPNQVALTSWLHLLQVALDKGTSFSEAGGKMKGLGRLEPASTSRKPCLFSVQVRRFWLALDLGRAPHSPGC